MTINKNHILPETPVSQTKIFINFLNNIKLLMILGGKFMMIVYENSILTHQFGEKLEFLENSS